MSLSNAARFALSPTLCATIAAMLGGLAATPAAARGQQLRQDPLPLWTLDFDLKYDDSPAPLTEMGGIVVDRSGRIFVAQEQERTVKVFLPDGTFLHALGRAGEGPGEFRDVSNLFTLGDSVWVNDYRLRRATIFRRDGSVARSVTFFHPLGGQRYGATYPFGDGFLVVPAIGMLELGRSEGFLRPLLVVDRQGVLRDTVGTLVLRNAAAEIDLPGSAVTWSDPPVPSRDLVGVAPGGRAVVIARGEVDAETSRRFVGVTRISPAGDTLAATRIEVEPAPVEDEYIERALATEVDRHANQFPSRRAARRAIRAAWGDVAEHFSPVQALIVDNDDRVWIRTTPVKNYWLVLDESGTPLARVDAPQEVEIRAAAGNLVWGVRYDELDVPSILRFRIRTRPGDGPDAAGADRYRSSTSRTS